MRFLLCALVGVDAAAENHKAVVEVFSGEVQRHVDPGSEIFVPLKPLGQIMFQKGAQRREYRVEQRHQQHGLRHIVGALEGELAVESEVPHNRGHQCHQVAQPVGQADQLVEQSKDRQLNDPRRGGEQHKFQRTEKFLLLFHLFFLLLRVLEHHPLLFLT